MSGPAPKGPGPKNQGQQQNRGQGQGPKPAWFAPPKTPMEAHKVAAATAGAKWNPVIRTEKANVRASNQRVKDVGNWWNEYLQTVQGAQQQTANAYAAANAQQQGLIGQSSALDNANTARLNSEEAGRAALRGQTPSGQAGQTAAASQAQRNYLSANLGGATAARGANQYAYLANQRRIGAGQKVAAKEAEVKRGQSIKQDIATSRKERGAETAKAFNELKNTYLENRLKERAFGLQKKEAGTSQRSAVAESALKRQEAAAGRRQQGVENRQKNREINQAQQKIRNENKRGGLTPSEQHTRNKERQQARQSRRGAMQEGWALFKTKAPPTNQKGWSEFHLALANQAEISPALAAWATKRIRAKYETELHQHEADEAVKKATRGF